VVSMLEYQKLNNRFNHFNYCSYFSVDVYEYSKDIDNILIDSSQQKEICNLLKSDLLLFYAAGNVVDNWNESEQLYHDIIPIWESECEQLITPQIVFLTSSKI